MENFSFSYCKNFHYPFYFTYLSSFLPSVGISPSLSVLNPYFSFYTFFIGMLFFHDNSKILLAVMYQVMFLFLIVCKISQNPLKFEVLNLSLGQFKFSIIGIGFLLAYLVQFFGRRGSDTLAYFLV